MCLPIFFDALLTIIIFGFVVDSMSDAYQCDKNFFWIGMMFLIYQFTFFLRNLIIMGLAYFTKKPDESG